jgi:hypothetical protein
LPAAPLDGGALDPPPALPLLGGLLAPLEPLLLEELLLELDELELELELDELELELELEELELDGGIGGVADGLWVGLLAEGQPVRATIAATVASANKGRASFPDPGPLRVSNVVADWLIASLASRRR